MTNNKLNVLQQKVELKNKIRDITSKIEMLRYEKKKTMANLKELNITTMSAKQLSSIKFAIAKNPKHFNNKQNI